MYVYECRIWKNYTKMAMWLTKPKLWYVLLLYNNDLLIKLSFCTFRKNVTNELKVVKKL